MANKVTIQFEAKGDKVLKRTLEQLDRVTKSLIDTQRKIINIDTKSNKIKHSSIIALRRYNEQLRLQGSNLKQLNISSKVYKNALNGNKLALDRVRTATNKHIASLKIQNKGMFETEHGTRILGGSFAVLRSKMLLVSFAASIFTASILRLTKVYGAQQKAEKLLETALGRRSNALLQFASAQQKVTAFGDEETIQAMSLIGAYTSNEKAIAQLTKASMNLATAKGMSLSSAVDLVSKSVFSSTNALSRYGITIEGTQGSVERFESATRTINDLYEDQAEAYAKTLPGAIDGLSNSVGDLGERFGSVLAPAILVSSKGLKVFVDSIDAEEIKAYGTAIIGMGVAYVGATKGIMLANKAMLIFNKVSKKNIAILAGTLAIGAIIDKFNLFADSTAEVSEELKNLENQLGSLNTKGEVTLSQTHALAVSELKYAHAMQNTSEIEKQREMNTLEYNQILEKHGVTEANFGRLMQENIQFAIEYNENKTKSKEIEQAHSEQTVKGVGQMLGAFSALASANKGMAVLAKNLAIASAVVDMYAGANKAFKQGGTLGFVTGSAIIAQGLVNISQMKAQKFEQGGMVGGQRHSQGGTIIEAERGEFVMSRNAVESIGIDNLANMNQGGGSGVTVNIQGNMIGNESFVRDILIPEIDKTVNGGLA